MKNDKQLSVRLYGEPIGILEQTSLGKMTFYYTNLSSQAISVKLPVREQFYDEFECEAFFGGLLPESENVRKIIGKRYGINHNNSFALLKAIGYDCAGAISFHPINEPVAPQYAVPLEGKIISEDSLYQHIKALPQKPLFLGVEGLRLSLAGIQDKAAVCIIDNQIAIPEHGCPTTHILKPTTSGLSGIVENEYFCLKIARQIGLTVPEVELRKLKDITYLLIKRYDRRVINNYVERIHQEDFCQALGITAAKKYQSDGGPTFKQCFELLQNNTKPAIDRNMLAAGVVFNFLIGNTDAHGKNFSLLHGKKSFIGLAPFYDLLCTRVYPDLTSKMAMKIGSKYENDEVLPRHWVQFCKDINYSFPALEQLILKQAEAILKAAQYEKENLIKHNLDICIIDKMIGVFEQNISRTVRRFNQFMP